MSCVYNVAYLGDPPRLQLPKPWCHVGAANKIISIFICEIFDSERLVCVRLISRLLFIVACPSHVTFDRPSQVTAACPRTLYHMFYFECIWAGHLIERTLILFRRASVRHNAVIFRPDKNTNYMLFLGMLGRTPGRLLTLDTPPYRAIV